MLSTQPDDAQLGKLLRAYPAMLRALATDRQGRIIAARSANGPADAIAPQDVADREWFRAPRESGGQLSVARIARSVAPRPRGATGSAADLRMRMRVNRRVKLQNVGASPRLRARSDGGWRWKA